MTTPNPKSKITNAPSPETTTSDEYLHWLGERMPWWQIADSKEVEVWLVKRLIHLEKIVRAKHE